MLKRLLYIFLLLGFSLSTLSAQSQQKVVEKRLRTYFRTYESPEVEVGNCKLVRFQLNPKKRTLVVHANANFAYQPFRPETTEKIYSDLRKVLPGPVNYYDITIMVGGKSIDELVPNVYRKAKDGESNWTPASDFMAAIDKGIHPAIVLPERANDKEYLASRGIEHIVCV